MTKNWYNVSFSLPADRLKIVMELLEGEIKDLHIKQAPGWQPVNRERKYADYVDYDDYNHPTPERIHSFTKAGLGKMAYDFALLGREFSLRTRHSSQA